MTGDRAKEMVEARHELGLALQNCAEVLSELAVALNDACLALDAASKKENEATLHYIAILEAALSQQHHGVN